MIFLKRLRLQDFKSYENEIIEFVRGRNVIHGQNGAGKTTILLAILYALLGRVQRLGKMVPKDELIRKGKNSFTLELEFEIDGVEYCVKRTNYLGNREPVAKLWRGTELIAERQRVVNKEILEIIGIDAATFENVIYVGQGEIPQIASQRAGDRKKLFDKFLNLDIYETIFTKFRDIEIENEVKLNSLQTRIRDLKSDIKTLPNEEKKLEEFQKRLEKRKEEEEKLAKDLEILQTRFDQEEKKRKEIELLEESEKAKANQIKKLNELILKKQNELEALLKTKITLEEPTLSELLEKHNELKLKYETNQKALEKTIKLQEQFELELQALKKRIKDSENTQKSIQNRIETNKNLILQEVPDLKTKEFSEWISIVSSKKDEIEKYIKELRAEMDLVKAKEEKLTNLKAKRKAMEDSIKNSEGQLQNITKKLEKIDMDWENTLKRLEPLKLDQLIQEQDTQLTQARETRNEITNKKAVLENELKKYRKELKEIESLKSGVKCPRCKQIVTDSHKIKIIEEIQAQIHKIETELKENYEALDSIDQKIEAFKTKKAQLEQQLKTLQRLKPLAENLQLINAQKKNDAQNLQHIQAEIKAIVIEKSSKEFDSEISEKNKQLTLYSNLLTQIKNVKEAYSDLNELSKKLEELSLEEGKLTKKYKPDLLKKARTDLEELKTNLATENKLIPGLSNLIERVKERNSYSVELKQLRSNLQTKKAKFDLKQYQTLKAEINSTIQKIGEIKNDIKTLTEELIPTLKARIKDLKAKLKELETKELELQHEQKKAILIKMLREFARAIPPVLRQQKTTQITAKATEIFLDLIGDTGEFDGIKVTENYGLYVTRYGMDEDITILSGGEQVLSCLAIRLAIAEILANQGLILLDEPTSHLDEVHVKDLVDVFQWYTPATQVITVTHDNEFEKIADLLIQVYKQEGVSQIL